jgi:2Fe-2S ferredoxin
MPKITFILPDTSSKTIVVDEGDSLMQAAVDNGIEQITADCGGVCFCSTCHCHIDEAWIKNVGIADETEISVMECAISVHTNSRLSCQVMITPELDGLVVHVLEPQW